MREMENTIGKLNLLLATISNKSEELNDLKRQFSGQLSRAPNHALKGDVSLDATLKIMSEIQERLDEVENTIGRLQAIQARAQLELDALQLTRKIEQAKTRLAELRDKEKPGESVTEKPGQEISELERFIQEASIRAGEAITGGPEAPAQA